MKKSLLVYIARKMAMYDRSSSVLALGGFNAFECLLDDYGYSFCRRDGSFCILDSASKVVCSVPMR